ncbi:Response regulator (modular protein) [Hyella patelloides LEGE 07179]|uniref:Response regulator (Modular protein) n=1 Tax=Hyella patelloides LEGE 07179 TaxID=945734 RepID=A0A563VZ09_9CYAN|nr:response regulator [Hyella patelloides]VEP16659.1 Response regulator (modular protein) [Hyella patelloides LEGE 07179]
MLTINRSVLIIDDDPDTLLLIKMGLQLNLDWKIITANSAEEGILKAKANYPDVILSDTDTPQIDGMQMLRALRENSVTKNIPVIFWTGIWKEINAQEYAHLGVKTVISKPCNFLTLANHIMQAAKVIGKCEVLSNTHSQVISNTSVLI